MKIAVRNMKMNAWRKATKISRKLIAPEKAPETRETRQVTNAFVGEAERRADKEILEGL